MAGSDDVGENSGEDRPKSSSSDSHSPYYFHPTDYSRQMHVNDDNIEDWSWEMKDLLLAKNRVCFID